MERSFDCDLFEFAPIKNSWVKKLVSMGLLVCLTQNKKLLLMNGTGSVLFGNKLGGLLCSQFSNKLGASEFAFKSSSSLLVTSGRLVLFDLIIFFTGCQTLFCRISNTLCLPP